MPGDLHWGDHPTPALQCRRRAKVGPPFVLCRRNLLAEAAHGAFAAEKMGFPRVRSGRRRGECASQPPALGGAIRSSHWSLATGRWSDSLQGWSLEPTGPMGAKGVSAGQHPADERLVHVGDQVNGPDPRGEHEPEPAPDRLFVAGHDRQ